MANSAVDYFSQKYTCNKCNRDFTLGEVKKGVPAPKQPSKPKVKSPTNHSATTLISEKDKKKFLKDLYLLSSVKSVKPHELPDNEIIEIGLRYGIGAKEALQFSGKRKPNAKRETSIPTTNSSPSKVEPAVQQPQDNSENEKAYLEEYKQCLADGEISSSEIRLLNKLAKSLGISEERARELEVSLTQPQLVLTTEEEEYLAEYKDAVADGELTATSRRLLNKIRLSMGISEERATEIENSLK